MKKTIIILSVYFVAITLLNASIVVSGEFEDLIYMTEDFRPYNYYENGELKGLSVDLLKLLWKELNVKPKRIELLPWARAYSILEKKGNAVLFTTARTQQRETLFKWVCPISVGTRNVFIAKKHRKIRLQSFEDAKKFKVGTIRDDAAEQIILLMGFDRTKVEPVSELIQNIKKMDSNRIDLIAFNEKTFFKYIEDKGISRDEYETLFLIKETVPCYAFNKEVSNDLIIKFQEALDHIRQSSKYRKLLEKYMME